MKPALRFSAALLSGAFGYVITFERVPQTIAELTLGLFSSKAALLFAISGFLLVFGMLVEATVIVMLLTPILVPVITAAGVDPVHFGLVMMTLVTFGGAFFASFPLSYLKNLPKYLKLALFPKKFNPQSYIEQIVEFAKINAKVNPCTTEEFPRPAKRPAYSSLENMMFKVTEGDEFRHWEVALKYFIEKLEEN